MPDAISCPQCGRQFRHNAALIGRKVQCRACGRAFRVPGPAQATTPTASSTVGGVPSQSPPLQDTDNLSGGSPHIASLPSEALIPQGPPSRPPRYPTSRRNKLLLGVGGILAASGVGLLLLLVALLQGDSSGGGPSVSASLGELLLGSSTPQTIPSLAGETSQDPTDQMTALVHLMELIRCESNLRELEPRILELFGRMLKAEAEGRRVPPNMQPQVEEALPHFDQRMVAASARLEIIPGGFDLRSKLVKLVQQTPLPAPPESPTQDGESGSLPTIASWVVWGWATPPPPESPEDQRRRQHAKRAAGGNPKVIAVYVRGITSNSMVQRLQTKVLEASHGTVVAPLLAGDVRVFLCGKVNDFRQVAHRLDVGPIEDIKQHEGAIYVEVDPSKLFERPKTLLPGPIPPLESVAADIPPAPSIALPPPPEPADIRSRRKDVRWEAGENLEGVEVVVHGSTETLKLQIFRRLADMGQVEKVRSQSDGFRPRTYHCDDIGDMRAFAGKLDLGPIIQFDDQKGVIVVIVDPTQFPE